MSDEGSDLTSSLEDLVEAATAPSARGGRGNRDGGTTAPDQAASRWQMLLSGEYADVETGALEQPILTVTDWDGVLRHFGLDPLEFEIVDDTVRMSRWQQSKRVEGGDRDVVWLQSYKARFRRITDRLPEADVAEHRKRVQGWRLPALRRTPGTGLGPACTFYTGWADWQLGKGEGGGVAGTTQRVLDSFEMQAKRVKDLRKVGRNIEGLSIWNMGDPNEGCDSNYANQLFTVELTRREQLNLGLDLWETGLRALAPLAETVEFGSVICNHGEWSRQGYGSKAVTNDSDNIGGYLADTLQRVVSGRKELQHVRFRIPRDEMTMTTVMSGVPVALAHGHKAPTGSKAELDWLRGQSIRILRATGQEPRLWMTAHRHHYEVKDYGPWTRIQHPSMDYGSKWYADTSGNWSSPGTFTCLVGEHAEAGGPLSGTSATGFSDEMVLVAD